MRQRVNGAAKTTASAHALPPPTTSGAASKHGRPREEEVLRELPCRCHQPAAPLHRLPRHRAVPRVLLGRGGDRDPPEVARLPAGGRRPLPPLGSGGGGRLDRQGGAGAARCHRAVWVWKLGMFDFKFACLVFLHFR